MVRGTLLFPFLRLCYLSSQSLSQSSTRAGAGEPYLSTMCINFTPDLARLISSRVSPPSPNPSDSVPSSAAPPVDCHYYHLQSGTGIRPSTCPLTHDIMMMMICITIRFICSPSGDGPGSKGRERGRRIELLFSGFLDSPLRSSTSHPSIKPSGSSESGNSRATSSAGQLFGYHLFLLSDLL